MLVAYTNDSKQHITKEINMDKLDEAVGIMIVAGMAVFALLYVAIVYLF